MTAGVALRTDCDTLPLLAVKLPVGVKQAVMVWLPAVNAEVVNVAWPLLSVTGLAEEPAKATPGQVPSMKVTFPVGVPEALVTFAVNVTESP